MTIWTLLWVLWGVVVLALFFAIEIASAPFHGTLSEQIWRLLGVGEELTTGVRLRRMGFLVVWLALFSLLSAHFIFQWV